VIRIPCGQYQLTLEYAPIAPWIIAVSSLLKFWMFRGEWGTPKWPFTFHGALNSPMHVDHAVGPVPLLLTPSHPESGFWLSGHHLLFENFLLRFLSFQVIWNHSDRRISTELTHPWTLERNYSLSRPLSTCQTLLRLGNSKVR
jgi:hypothetical protein